jgi:hypothetical protein
MREALNGGSQSLFHTLLSFALLTINSRDLLQTSWNWQEKEQQDQFRNQCNNKE